MKRITLLVILLSSVVYATHPKLFFSSIDISSNNLYNRRTLHTSLELFYDYLKNDAWNNRYSTLNNRYLAHYASDMAFIATIDLSLSSSDRAILKTRAINQLSNIYNFAIGSNDLDQASAIIHISLVYDILYNDMTVAQKYDNANRIKNLADSMIDAVYDFDPVTNSYQVKPTKKLFENNHQMNAAAGIGIGILAIKGDWLNASDSFSEAEAEPYLEAVNNWVAILDANNFAPDGSGYEGVFYSMFGLCPMLAYYEALQRDDPAKDLFSTTNFRFSPEWLAMELIPAPARATSTPESLFDFSNVNASYFSNYAIGLYTPPHGAISNMTSIFAVLGGIFSPLIDIPAGAATWIFNHHASIISSRGDEFDNYFGTNSIMALTQYVNNAPSSLESILSNRKFFEARGLIVRDGYADDGTLFTFETNKAYNSSTGKYITRWDEDDNNSFTFYAYGQRWIIDNGKKINGTQEEQSNFHNTILVDGYWKPYYDNNDLQIADWYDYQYYGELYSIISDVTNSWLYKINPNDPTDDGTGTVRYFDDPADPQYSSLPAASKFSSFLKDRRQAQFINKEGSLPPYVILFDDIQQSNSVSHDYTHVLNVGQGNSVRYSAIDKIATLTNAASTNILEIYYSSSGPIDNFGFDNPNPDCDIPHPRLLYTVQNVLNPHFHVILMPSPNTSSAAHSVSFHNMLAAGIPVASVATIDFGAFKDFSLYSYQRTVSDNTFRLDGYAEPVSNYGVVPGIMAYARKQLSTNEFTKFFMDRGSFLMIDSKELARIGGPSTGDNPVRTARVLLNNSEINIFKVNGTGRFSYKIYGKNINQFKIYDIPQTFTSFNNYNYLKSTEILNDYFAESIALNQVKVYWTCGEVHNIIIYYWDPAHPENIFNHKIENLSPGNNNSTLNIDTSKEWCFRLEGTSLIDGFVDIGHQFSYDNLNIEIKIMMEGPYENSAGMSNSLKTSGFIPAFSPYIEDPISASAIQPDNLVDWILVQLFQTLFSGAIASKSAYLLTDGTIIEVNGNEKLGFKADPGSYYLTIKHRNHILVTSSTPVSLDYDTTIDYDFTTGYDKYYFNNSVKQLSTNHWGMVAGDMNQDGQVTSADYVQWYNDEQNGATGYVDTDLNGDGVVDGSDFQIWQSNAREGY
ncbi:hypothetical protein GF406_18275 [candidate division KSB1 bacterium]|nr:hypothetical protein [candidate division KSB1 bacterium]